MGNRRLTRVAFVSPKDPAVPSIRISLQTFHSSVQEGRAKNVMGIVGGCDGSG